MAKHAYTQKDDRAPLSAAFLIPLLSSLRFLSSSSFFFSCLRCTPSPTRLLVLFVAPRPRLRARRLRSPVVPIRKLSFPMRAVRAFSRVLMCWRTLSALRLGLRVCTRPLELMCHNECVLTWWDCRTECHHRAVVRWSKNYKRSVLAYYVADILLVCGVYLLLGSTLLGVIFSFTSTVFWRINWYMYALLTPSCL